MNIYEKNIHYFDKVASDFAKKVYPVFKAMNWEHNDELATEESIIETCMDFIKNLCLSDSNSDYAETGGIRVAKEDYGGDFIQFSIFFNPGDEAYVYNDAPKKRKKK